MVLKCKHCDKEWEYKGHSTFYATCPKCHYLVHVKNVEIKEEMVKKE